MRPVTRLALLAQAAYYIVTGIWPIVSIETFQLVTGPKLDLWLVRMVGLLAAAIGASLLVAARARRRSAEVLVLALASAAAFTSIDVVYVLAGRISPIYLADALVEVILAAVIAATWRGADAMID